MPPKQPNRPDAQKGQKRKAPASFDNNTKSAPRTKRQNTQRDARTLAVQTSSKAFKNGELDVDKFVKAREYEIRALEEGLERSKKALTTRAFQQVPKELRRRTASHNASRVPKRLRGRAKTEMVEDNTPTVTARRRKPTRHQRLRTETIKKLRALGSKRKTVKNKGGEIIVVAEDGTSTSVNKPSIPGIIVRPRKPRTKKNTLRAPPVPKARFRKRQLHKSWLPTHLFHAKRAKMTLPRDPLWRFAIPLTPSAKCYRPTHRAVSERGAIAWDMSYMSTMSLEGLQKSIEGLLRGLNISHPTNGPDMLGVRGKKWRTGTRTWEGWLFERDSNPNRPIALVTIIWCATDPETVEGEIAPRRKMMIRVHPSAFLQVWEQVTRLCKVQKPQVVAEDLRFEIGSIEIRGPGSTEALQGALWPSADGDGKMDSSDLWKKLAGLENPATLPARSILAFKIQDPRLHHPPRTIKPPPPDWEEKLLGILADWPGDRIYEPPAIFDYKSRKAACRAMSSQKAINRRKADSKPGQYPETVDTDPRVPILMYTSRNTTSGHASSWTLLLPWQAVNAVWYSIMYYPLSTGGQVRFGGLQEQRQIAFESGSSWFPGDFTGTEAGDTWDEKETARRKAEWDRRPKGKRTEFSSIDLGHGRKGEIGDGWSCDWKRLLDTTSAAETENSNSEPVKIHHIPAQSAKSLLSGKANQTDSTTITGGLATVRVTYLTRGVPSPCARIYRLPAAPTTTSTATTSTGPTEPSTTNSDGATNSDLREQWLSLLPSKSSSHDKKAAHTSKLPLFPKGATEQEVQKRIAAYLLTDSSNQKDAEDKYPDVPGEEDLIGFVTTGEFCLTQGKGVGIGSVLLSRVMAGQKGVDTGTASREKTNTAQICIVRNAGERIGRLARWEIV